MQFETNKRYFIKYSGQYCHGVGQNGDREYLFEPRELIFVGQIESLGKRNIFKDPYSETYFMFAAKKFDYFVSTRKMELLDEIKETEKEIERLKRNIEGFKKELSEIPA